MKNSLWNSSIDQGPIDYFFSNHANRNTNNNIYKNENIPANNNINNAVGNNDKNKQNKNNNINNEKNDSNNSINNNQNNNDYNNKHIPSKIRNNQGNNDHPSNFHNKSNSGFIDNSASKKADIYNQYLPKLKISDNRERSSSIRNRRGYDVNDKDNNDNNNNKTKKHSKKHSKKKNIVNTSQSSLSVFMNRLINEESNVGFNSADIPMC